MSILALVFIVLSLGARGHCENEKRGVYVGDVNPGVVFASGHSIHGVTAGHGPVIPSGVISPGHGVAYGSAYGLASHGVHHENLVGNYGSSVTHVSAHGGVVANPVVVTHQGAHVYPSGQLIALPASQIHAPVNPYAVHSQGHYDQSYHTPVQVYRPVQIVDPRHQYVSQHVLSSTAVSPGISHVPGSPGYFAGRGGLIGGWAAHNQLQANVVAPQGWTH